MTNSSMHMDRLASSGAITYHGSGGRMQRLWVSLAIVAGLIVLIVAAGLSGLEL